MRKVFLFPILALVATACSNSQIGQVDRRGIKITTDIPNQSECSRKGDNLKRSTVAKCLVEGLTYTQVEQVFDGVPGATTATKGTVELVAWTHPDGGKVLVFFKDGRLSSRTTGLIPE